jgi:hypothetical protein
VGRDFISALREIRTCRLNNASGACVWAALTDQATSDNVKGSVLSREGGHHKTPTTTLDALLTHFSIERIDLLSADCEGCEEVALRSLDLERVQVDAVLIENPPCRVMQRFANRSYTIIPLMFSYDWVFLHPQLVRRMIGPPVSTHMIRGGLNPRNKARFEAEAEKVEKRKRPKFEMCSKSSASITASVWWGPGTPWPPLR